jgi:hypothetical protein
MISIAVSIASCIPIIKFRGQALGPKSRRWQEEIGTEKGNISGTAIIGAAKTQS